MSNMENGTRRAPKPSSTSGFTYDDLEYEDEVDYELLCPICREPMLEPMITTPCQHVFCSTCLKKAFLHQAQQRISHHCPSCRTEFVVTDADDDPVQMYTEPLVGHVENDLSNRLDILRVRCPNKGCTIVRERFLLPDHVENHCLHTVFPCYDQTCYQSVERRHMRLHCTHELIECRHCHEWLERYQLADHEGECPQLESFCPSCESNFRRNEFKAHQELCQSPIFVCRGEKYGCQAILSDAAQLSEHQSLCTIYRLGETIEQQDELLQAHRDALMTLTRKNEDLESRLLQVENDMRLEKEAKSGDSRLDEIERLLEAQQQQVTERVSKAEMLSFNSVQRQGQFNQYMEACLARMQTDIGAMHHAMMRGRMFPGPSPPMPKPPGDDIQRPGSEGSESVSRQLNAEDDLMPPATRTMSATEYGQQSNRGPELGPFASLAALLPSLSAGAQMPLTQPHPPPINRNRTDTMARPRRSSEERSVKL